LARASTMTLTAAFVGGVDWDESWVRAFSVPFRWDRGRVGRAVGE